MNVFARLWQLLVWLLLMTPLRCLVPGHASEGDIPFEPVSSVGDGDDDSDVDSDSNEHMFGCTEPYCSCESQSGDGQGGSSEETRMGSQSIRNRNFSPSSSPAAPAAATTKSQAGDSTSPKQFSRQGAEAFVKNHKTENESDT